MEIVVADDIAALRPIAPHVKRAHIARLQADMGNVVVFDGMIVAVEQDGGMRPVVNAVMRDHVAHTLQHDGRLIAARPVAEVVDVVVQRGMPARRQRAAFAAVQYDPAIAGW